MAKSTFWRVPGYALRFTDNCPVYCVPIKKGRNELIKEGVAEESIHIQRSFDLRYQGQSYYLNITLTGNIQLDIQQQAIEDFHRLHKERYGHQLDLSVELVNLRVGLTSAAGEINLVSHESLKDNNQAEQACEQIKLIGINESVLVYARTQLKTEERITGPMLITETVSTSYIAPGWNCEKDGAGNLKLNRL